jgi:hypothetical protein
VLESGAQPLSKVLISGGGRCNVRLPCYSIMHAIMCCDAVDDGQVMHDPTKPINVIAKASNISHRQCVMLYI